MPLPAVVKRYFKIVWSALYSSRIDLLVHSLYSHLEVNAQRRTVCASQRYKSGRQQM